MTINEALELHSDRSCGYECAFRDKADGKITVYDADDELIGWMLDEEFIEFVETRFPENPTNSDVFERNSYCI